MVLRAWLREKITLHSESSPREELANGLTHAFGAVLSVLAGVVLVQKALANDNLSELLSYLVFSVSMLTLYGSSAIYHLSTSDLTKRFFRVMDHLSIYFLIAGTYTPVVLGVGGRAGWIVFAVIWIEAAIGSLFKFRYWGRYGFLHLSVYIAMGWTIVLAWDSILMKVPTELRLWAFAGGVTYTLGTLAYAAKKLPYHHALWHLFVLGGSACFFFGIYFSAF